VTFLFFDCALVGQVMHQKVGHAESRWCVIRDAQHKENPCKRKRVFF
jgi:hypothetical protein